MNVRKRTIKHSTDAIKSLIIEAEYSSDEVVIVKLYRYVGIKKIPLYGNMEKEIDKFMKMIRDEVRAPAYLDGEANETS